MSFWTATARQALNAARLSSSRASPAASLIHRRGLSAERDSPLRQKLKDFEERNKEFLFVFTTGLVFLTVYAEYNLYSGAGDKKEEEVGEAPQKVEEVSMEVGEASESKLQVQFKTEY